MTRLAAVGMCLLLAGCDPATLLAGVSAGTGVYQTVGNATKQTGGVIAAFCDDWHKRRGDLTLRISGEASAARAQMASGNALWLDATCSPDAPPPSDPIAAAVWMAGVAARVKIALDEQP